MLPVKVLQGKMVHYHYYFCYYYYSTTTTTTTTTGDGPHLNLAQEPFDPDSVIKPITRKDCLPKLAINPNNLLVTSDDFEYEQ